MILTVNKDEEQSMSKFVAFLICLIVALTLLGCDEEDITFDEPAIEVYKNGKISQTIVENFDKPYYDIEELKQYIESHVDECNALLGDEGQIVLKDVYSVNNNVFAIMEYENINAIKTFTEEEYFYGTVNEAYDAGYTMDVSLKSLSDGEIIGKPEIMDMKKNHIFIIPDSGIVHTSYKILYVSAGIEFVDDKTVRVAGDADGLAYIVTK